MQLLAAKKIHLVGIKGVALTALALCLSDAGIEVSGSDVAEEFVTEGVLKKRGFKLYASFSPTHIKKDLDLVVYTGAHQGVHNPEVVAAQKLGISVISHAQALGELTESKKLIAVCGTGGKSTTSAMLAWVLEQTGKSPGFAVGVGNISNFGVSGRFHKDSAWFVAEADEYAVDPTADLRPRFVFLHPQIIICTNLKYDHPDIYPTFEDTKAVFLAFFNTLPDSGSLILNGDDSVLVSLSSKLATKAKVIMVKKSSLDKTMKLTLPGEFNLMNAQMALTAASSLGIKETEIKEALSGFDGTTRRFEKKGVVGGADWYDDYAHTPEEVEVTLKALRERYPNKNIIAVFQPHTYSRTKALFSGFSRCFTKADEVVLLDIFASAREKMDTSVSSDLLAESIIKLGQNSSVKNMKTITAAAKYLVGQISTESVVMTLGAGDVYKIYDEIIKRV